MYIEASAPRKSGDTASLITLPYSNSQRLSHCVTFWYNMYGADMGTLAVYYNTGGVFPTTPAFTVSGKSKSEEPTYQPFDTCFLYSMHPEFGIIYTTAWYMLCAYILFR